MPRLFKRSHRYNVAKNCFLARIILLDNTTIEFNLLPEVTGSDCLEKVAQVLVIQEISYFGLQYQTKWESLRWVDREKPLRKQLEKYAIDGARNAELRFRVQYYVTTVTKLQYEITRYLYFLQLKHLILNGDLLCSHDLAIKLASYALQAEFGDYDEQKHTQEFLSDYIFLPTSIGAPSVIHSLTEKASKLHQRHRGMSPASAELMYIKLAQQLAEYGHEAFQTLDVHGSAIWIGACFIGVFVKHSNGQPNVYFKWPDIFRLKVRDKNFAIETPGETVYFKMPDHNTAQYVYRMMISQHKFYRSEMEGTPGFSWLSGVEGTKKRSRSLHDLRTRTTEPKEVARSISEIKKPGKQQPDKQAPLQRPLHKFVYRESASGQFSPTHSSSREDAGTVRLLSISGEGACLPPDPQHPSSPEPTATVVTIEKSPSPPPHTHVKSPSRHKHTVPSSPTIPEPPKQQKEQQQQQQQPLQQQPQLESTDIPDGDLPPAMLNSQDDDAFVSGGEVPDGMVQSTADPSSATSGQLESPSNGHVRNGPSGSDGSDDQMELAESQDTFDLVGTRKQKLTGSLERLDLRTPPRSLKIRTFSIEEQQEQELASGTHDRRGQHLERKLKSGKFFSEYELLPKKKLSADTSSGHKPENVHKNRYRDILPYEDTRVNLNAQNNTSNNDYINASYVNFTVSGVNHQYVVAQGPLEHTCTDFWQMVWEQKMQIVLMLTNEVEDGRTKCHRYFPRDEHVEGEPDYVQFEQYRISRLFVEKTATVISRGFQLKHIPSGESREITHLQYIDWPDHGIPEDPQPFLNFLIDVRSLRKRYDPSIPVLVHCSAGVGRSGVVVLVDLLMAKVDCGEILDIPKSLKDLRQQRMHLVQVVGQYKFVYSAIIHYIRRARLI